MSSGENRTGVSLEDCQLNDWWPYCFRNEDTSQIHAECLTAKVLRYLDPLRSSQWIRAEFRSNGKGRINSLALTT